MARKIIQPLFLPLLFSVIAMGMLKNTQDIPKKNEL